MKNIQLLVALVLIFIVTKTSDAQEFSILGGANISNMSMKANGQKISNDMNFKPRIGGHLGLLIDLKMGKTFSLEPGLIFITKGYRFDIPDIDDVRYRYNTMYMDIPVLAKFNWNPKEKFRLYGGLGPVLGIAMTGKLKSNGLNDTQKSFITTNYPGLPLESEKIDFGDEAKRMDIGLMFTGGMNVSNFRVGIFYNQGLRSLEYQNYTQRNRVAGVHVGYTFQFRNEEE